MTDSISEEAELERERTGLISATRVRIVCNNPDRKRTVKPIFEPSQPGEDWQPRGVGASLQDHLALIVA
jgi:hypothetical protein